MQRIAYLLYRNRQEINSDNVLILSPNEEFIQYLSDVLPSLGEKNPLNMTFRKLVKRLYHYKVESESELFERISQKEVATQDSILRSRDFSEYLKKEGAQLLLSRGLPFRSIKHQEQEMISQKVIQQLFNETPTNASLVERIQGTKAKLESYWDDVLRAESQKPTVQEEMQHLSEDEQLNYLGKLIPDDPNKLAFYVKKILEKRFSHVAKNIRKLNWLNQVRLLETIYQFYTHKKLDKEFQSLDFAVAMLLMKHLFVEKLPVFKVEFLLVDEIQDYTSAQLILLSELFPKAKVTVVGDENQAIFNTNLSFTEIELILKGYHKTTETYHLQKSYRSSGAITATFNQLIESNRQVIPVQPLGEPVSTEEFDDLSSFAKLVEERLAEIGDSSLTIITKTSLEQQKLINLFDKELIKQKKIVVLSIMLAKGLEFDHVILYDVSQENYHTVQDRRLLYTAVSRGMKTLMISYKEKLTEFFK